MSLSFVLVGIFNILILFGVIKFDSKIKNWGTIIALSFCLFGLFGGDIETAYFSINILYLISMLILLFLFFDKKIFSKMYVVLFIGICIALVLLFDLNFLSVFSFALYYMELAIVFLFFYSQPKQLFTAILIVSILYFLIDGYFQYMEMGFAYIDISKIVLPVILLGGISYAYTFSTDLNLKKVNYE